MSLIYLSSSNIFALINYTGFATWVSNWRCWVEMSCKEISAEICQHNITRSEILETSSHSDLADPLSEDLKLGLQEVELVVPCPAHLNLLLQAEVLLPEVLQVSPGQLGAVTQQPPGELRLELVRLRLRLRIVRRDSASCK